MNWMDWTGWGDAARRLLGKAPKRRARPAPCEAGQSRVVRMDGCGILGRAPLPLETELQLYHDMRRSFPVLDTAVTRLVQLCGQPRVEGPAAVREELQRWMDCVPAGPGQRGLGSWLETHLDQMLVYGKAVGRIEPARSRREVAAVYNVDPREVRLEMTCDPLLLRVLRRPPGCLEWAELPPSLTLLSLHAPQGSAHGTSLLRSLPFVAETLSTIQNATGQVWQRVGAPSFHVNWTPEPGTPDPQGSYSNSVTTSMEQTFREMMAARKHGEVRDFFTSGNVSISLIGPNGEVMAVQEPFRVFMEQMVAVTGLPPWLLGLHWSSTERLSVQQADLLVANIEALRREVQPQLDYLLDVRQKLRGAAGRFRVVWTPVNLRDATEQARAEAWAEQARQRRIENARRMWELGFWSQERAARDADETLASVHRRYEAPPGGPADMPARLTPALDE
jgi:hypothetical protein